MEILQKFRCFGEEVQASGGRQRLPARILGGSDFGRDPQSVESPKHENAPPFPIRKLQTPHDRYADIQWDSEQNESRLWQWEGSQRFFTLIIAFLP